MFFSNQLKNISNLKHCFFSRKNGVSKGIYSSLNCGLGSCDDKKNIIQNLTIVCKKLNYDKKPDYNFKPEFIVIKLYILIIQKKLKDKIDWRCHCH